MKNAFSIKTWIALIIIIMLLGTYSILKIFPHKAIAPSNSSQSSSTPVAYPTLDATTATTTTLKLGDHIMVGTTLLTPTEVLQDSRCATGLQCIQAGTVVLAVNASSEDGASVIELPLGKAVTQQGLTLTLTNVSPYPRAQQKVAAGDYVFTLTVQQNLQ